MSHSVSYPNDCHAVCYQNVSLLEDQWEWQDFIEDLRPRAKEVWPSLEDCDRWLDREDHALLSNIHAYIGISEYGGLAAIWLKSRAFDRYSNYHGDDQVHANLADHWCKSIIPRFEQMFAEYQLIGRASNGEAFYRRIGGSGKE